MDPLALAILMLIQFVWRSQQQICYYSCIDSNSASSRYWTHEWTFSHSDTDVVTSKKKIQLLANITHIVPVHFPDEPVPLITSQYLPSGSEVENDAFQTESSLLIATYPIAPQKDKYQYTANIKQ